MLQLFLQSLKYKFARFTWVMLLIVLSSFGQLIPGQLLRVQSDGVHFELSSSYLKPEDTSHSNLKVMTRWVADSSIAVINSTIATKLAATAFTAAAITTLYGYTPANGASYYLASNPNSYISIVPAQTFASLTSKPTTLSGYGITDAYPLSGNPSSFLTSITSGNVTTALGFTPVTNARTISTTSPITGGGDLSANRTIAINNAAADWSTRGAASFATEYFDDNGSGIINLAFLNGTGTVSANAVTVNATKGKITYTSPSISAGNAIGVTLTNSYISSSSIITVNINGNGSTFATNIQCYIKSQTSGSCVINIANLSLLSLFNSSFIIDFMVVN